MADTDIVTIEEARLAVGLNEANNTHDSILSRMVTAVSAKLDDHIGPVVIRTITGEEHDGGHHDVLLKHRPVASVTTVTEYDYTTPTVLTATTNASKPANGYRLVDGGEAGVLERRSAGYRSRFACGDGNVVVTYEAGRFATTADVEDLYKEAAEMTLRAWWSMEDIQTATADEYDVPASRWPTFALAKATLELVDHERRHGVGIA